jgi:hypothetical protein
VLGRILKRLADDRAMVLPIALGLLAVLSIMVVTLVNYSTANSRHANFSKTRTTAFNLAESGINNAVAVLNLPTNDALNPNLLPPRTTTYDSAYLKGRVVWSGTFNNVTNVWSLTSTGYYRNPNSPGSAEIKRTLSAIVVVVPPYVQAMTTPVWDWIYATRTGTSCDQQLNNNVNGTSRLYVVGNLCIGNNAVVQQSALAVRKDLFLSNGNTAVGSASNRVETYVGQGCSWQGYTTPLWANPCGGNQDIRRIYSKLSDGTVGVNMAVPNVEPPVADWNQWYPNARPGPVQNCTSSTGAPPVFDTNFPLHDNSVPGNFEIGKLTAWECTVGPAFQEACLDPNRPLTLRCPTGYIRWDPATATTPGTLTILGTIYIDGDMKLTNRNVNLYRGIGTVYLSGSFYLDGALCGAVTADLRDCNFAAWNPNTTMLTWVAEGHNSHDGSVPDGRSIYLQNNAKFQGALFAKEGLEMGNVAKSDGPMVGAYLIFGNNVTNDTFPHISLVGSGMPGNQGVTSQVNPPQNFTG